MIKFEKVSKYESDPEIQIPVRATECSAGYDFCVAEDTIIQPISDARTAIYNNATSIYHKPNEVFTLSDAAQIIKDAKAKVTLVPTGIKCRLTPRTYLELSMRSSIPLKHYLILANGVGIIDADYYNNPDNEGEIFFQIINLAPFPIKLQKGDRIGQGIIKEYLTVAGDEATGTRMGGFGSTN